MAESGEGSPIPVKSSKEPGLPRRIFRGVGRFFVALHDGPDQTAEQQRLETSTQFRDVLEHLHQNLDPEGCGKDVLQEIENEFEKLVTKANNSVGREESLFNRWQHSPTPKEFTDEEYSRLCLKMFEELLFPTQDKMIQQAESYGIGAVGRAGLNPEKIKKSTQEVRDLIKEEKNWLKDQFQKNNLTDEKTTQRHFTQIDNCGSQLVSTFQESNDPLTIRTAQTNAFSRIMQSARKLSPTSTAA